MNFIIMFLMPSSLLLSIIEHHPMWHNIFVTIIFDLLRRGGQ
ncbi:hypothetical protein KP509_05G008400 [Ceratopteris richardii]|uniref:Uncharacterized protein n=1 Tax=Ceratopteris richardii TaxID=49495 RepID=A0A8T2UR28_CERRI|nr:hypothetical protein KP509_05G008400 [Ceratopteris richardii]